MHEESFLKLYACCIPVKGAFRSIICDVQRFSFEFIPNALFELITEFSKLSIPFVDEHFDKNQAGIIKEYFSFLVEKELAFWATEEELDRFPNLSLEWDSPYEITNAIIDIDDDYDFTKVLHELSNLGCYALEIRYYRKPHRDELLRLIHHTESSRILNIHFLIPYHQENEFDDFFNLFPRVFRVAYYNAPFEKKIDYGMGAHSIYIQQSVVPDLHCGVISSSYFNPHISTFTEAQFHNTCLNRKISIDKKGYIKNCPSMTNHFGHISEVGLKSVVINSEFRKVWKISKDETKTCKDCEFRYICTDCRAYIEDPEDIYSKPLKCGYNPYNGHWEEWSTHPLKQKAIEHYGLHSILEAQQQH